MTLLEHVYAIKNLIAHGPASDDFSYSNRLIAHFLQIARARLLEQKADKYNFISEQSYQDLCVDMALSQYHNCCEGPELDCKVLKSTTTIPKFLNTRWGNFLKVTDLEGTVIPEFNLTQNRLSVYSLTGTRTGWFIHDNHLYVINNSFLQKILLNALFDDPSQIHDLNCPISGEGCADFMDEEFPIDPDLIDPMYRLTLEFLTRSIMLPKDEEQDATDETGKK